MGPHRKTTRIPAHDTTTTDERIGDGPARPADDPLSPRHCSTLYTGQTELSHSVSLSDERQSESTLNSADKDMFFINVFGYFVLSFDETNGRTSNESENKLLIMFVY